MNCWRIKKLLSAYVDDELSSAEKAQVARHLDTCPGCRGELVQYRLLKNTLGSIQQPLPDGFTARVMSRTRLIGRQREAGEPRRWTRASSWRYALASLGVAGLTLVALLLGFNSSGETPGYHTGAAPTLAGFENPDLLDGDEKKINPELPGGYAESDPQPEHYLADHLANSEIQTATSQDLSRHVIANEALSREAEQTTAPKTEYSSDITFSMVSSSTSRPLGADVAGLPTLPVDTDSEAGAASLGLLADETDADDADPEAAEEEPFEGLSSETDDIE